VFNELSGQTGADDRQAGEGHRTRWVRWVDPSYRAVLAVPGARALIAAGAASEIGNWLYNAALLGYVYGATRSAGWVGAATICRLVPYVLLGPFGGAVADRYSRRAVLLAGDALRVLVMAALAATVASAAPVTLVIAFTALASAAGCAEKPAAQALLPRLVGDARLGPANALLHTVQDLGVLIGPAIGAILLAVAPAWVAFAANGATFAVSALLISALRPDAPRAGGRTPEVAQLAAGLRAVRGTAFARWLIVVVAMVEFTYGAQTVQLVVYATQSLGLGSGGYGVLLTAAGVGGLASTLVNGRLSTSRRVSLIVVVTGALACATQLAYAGVQVLAIALAVTVIGTAGLVSCEVVGETALARIVPREALGRVVGVFEAVSVAAMIAGAVLAPVLAAATSLRASLLILGGAALAITLLCHLGLRGLDAHIGRRAGALGSGVKVLQGLPVTVEVPPAVLAQCAAAQFRLDRTARTATVTTETATTLLRVDGNALLGALAAAPSLRPAPDLSGTAAGAGVPPRETAAAGDPRWAKA
jgi:MFS family permease